MTMALLVVGANPRQRIGQLSDVEQIAGIHASASESAPPAQSGRKEEMATMSEVSTDSLKAAVDRIAPVIEAHREQAEQERRLPNEVVAAMRQAGLLRLWTPKEYGGSEVNLRTFMELGESIARIDS